MTDQSNSLETTIRNAGAGWILDRFEPPGEGIKHVKRMLAQVNARATERGYSDFVELSEQTLADELERNPQYVVAFLQAVGGTRSAEMLLMVWRLLDGRELHSMQLDYEHANRYHLCIVLRSPFSSADDETYESKNIHDFALLRHVGVLELNDMPVFAGFYPLNLQPLASA